MNTLDHPTPQNDLPKPSLPASPLPSESTNVMDNPDTTAPVCPHNVNNSTNATAATCHTCPTCPSSSSSSLPLTEKIDLFCRLGCQADVKLHSLHSTIDGIPSIHPHCYCSSPTSSEPPPEPPPTSSPSLTIFDYPSLHLHRLT